MHLFKTSATDWQKNTVRDTSRQAAGHVEAGKRLCALAMAMLTLVAGMPSGFSQQALGAGAKVPEKAASVLPAAPAPVLTEPLNLRTSARDFSKPTGRFLGNPINMYPPDDHWQGQFCKFRAAH